MDEQTNQTDQIDIHPTGKVEGEYSDDALTGLFNAHIALVNNEEQTTWQRYNIMLVANSIVIGFLLQTQSINESSFSIKRSLFPLLGILLCFAWYQIHQSGRAYHSRWMKLARRFNWKTLDRNINPIMQIHNNKLKRSGTISRWSLGVV